MPEHPSPDLPVLYLHCGGYKTGTTSIQGFFSLHRDELLEKYKILYPLAGRRVNSGVCLPGQPTDACYAHHLLAHYGRKALRQPKSERQEFRKVIRILKQEFSKSGARSLFISTELLTSSGSKLRRLILSQFTSFRIRILYTVRHPSDYFESMNNQILGSGAKQLCSHGELPFLRNLDGWAEAVGRENVRVFSFSPRRFPEYAQEFFEAVEIPGLAEFAVPRLPRLNSSASLEGITVRNLLAHHLPERSRLNHRQRHEMDLLVNEIDQALGRRTPLVTLTLEERRLLDELNKPGMETIIRRYLTPASTGFLLVSQSAKADAEKNLGQACTFTSGDVRMIHQKLTRAKIVEPIRVESLFDGRNPPASAAFSHADLQRAIDRLTPRKWGKSSPKTQPAHVQVPQPAGGLNKRFRNSGPALVANSLFGLMKSRVIGSAFIALPASLRKWPAEALSSRGYHAQALALAPDPLGQPALRAGIYTAFNRRHPEFSNSFTLCEGIAWLTFHHDPPPPAQVLAQWLVQLPSRYQDRALAFLCQIGFTDFKSFLPFVPSRFPFPRWFSERLSPPQNPPPTLYRDFNLNLLTINNLKRSGHQKEAASLLRKSFSQLDLLPPPADLFNGFSPSPFLKTVVPDPAYPKISVILCAWNAANFLPVALSSIVSQTYPNLEIIAIDDGSTDGTHAVLEQWLGHRSDATIIRHADNRGAYPCRNVGLERATGEFVTFHDADDWSAPEKIERQWRAIVGKPNALASSSDWFRIDVRTGLCFTRRVYPICRWNCSSFMFHRATALQFLGFYDPVRTGADSEYVARFEAVFAPHRHIRLKLPLSIGLEHGASLTGNSESGFDTSGLSRQRQDYLETWRTWHAARWNQPGGLRLAQNQSLGTLPIS